MLNIGLFIGKFLPLHRGHIQSIIEASTQVDILYVVRSYRNNKRTIINGKKVKQSDIEHWLIEQFKGLDHIKVLTVDESDIPEYPNGWEEWSKLLKSKLHSIIQQYTPKCDSCDWCWITTNTCEQINLTVFGGELNDKSNYETYFKPCKYVLIDPLRQRNNIRATQIRQNIYEHWDYLPSIVRQFFVKKILITGVESCGKTTLTRYLAKIFNTSWSEEVGRDYAKDIYSGNEKLLNLDDFARIAYLQREQDFQAYKTANKIVFIDTDATVTNYYCMLYLNKNNSVVRAISDQNILNNEWDIIIFMEPDVPWIDDGQRMISDKIERKRLSEYLKRRYLCEYNIEMHIINGSYQERLNKAVDIVNGALK